MSKMANSEETDHNYNTAKKSATSIRNSPVKSSSLAEQRVVNVRVGTKNVDALCNSIASKNKNYLNKGV